MNLFCFADLRRGLFVLLLSLTSAFGLSVRASAQPAIGFVQGNFAVPQGATSSVNVPYTAAQTAGNLNVVVVGWNDTSAQVQTVTDSRGNSYVRAIGPTTRNGLGSLSIYYSANIASAGANVNTVTVRFSTAAQYPDIRIAEYRGLAAANPLDVAVGAQGNNSNVSDSGTASTTAANDLLVGANLVSQQTTAAGTGYTNRMITTTDGDILEDRVVTSVGSYNATAFLSGGAWIMQMAAFRAAPPADTQPPSPPASLSATATSSAQISLTWTASSDNVGVTSYLVERCQGVGCGTFVQIGSSSATGYSDTAVVGGTTYNYRVRAADAAANLSTYSNNASATTPAPPDVQAPTAPANLVAAASSTTQVNLTWTASSDNVGVTSYLIERCAGVGCTTFGLVGTASTAGYSDSTVSSSTSYRYRVRATDAAANLSSYSNSVSVTTPAQPDTQSPTAPANLTATAMASTQVNLTWSASTDDVGVISYLIERCQPAGCSAFVQIGASASSNYVDGTVSGSTSYSYRVRASDAAANLSSYSNIASVITPAGPTAIALVQTARTDAGVATSSSLAFTSNNIAGNWIAVAIRAGQTGQTFVVSDSRGNTYRRAVQLNETSDGTTLALFYAENIRSGANTVTVSDTLTGATLRFVILEYSGVATSDSLDTTATAQGTSATPSSGLVATAANGSLILGILSSANGQTVSAGTGFVLDAQVPDAPTTKLIVEDQRQIVAGPVAAVGTLSAPDDWGALVAAFRPAGPALDTEAPTAPTSMTATAVSSGRVDLSWAPSTDNIAVTNYLIERCQGAGCSSFLQIGTSILTTYGDIGVNADTSYSYRVRSTDAAANLSPYSNIGSATTTPVDSQAPTAPTNLTASAASSALVNLTWTAAADNVGVTSYLIERCSGAGCSAFASIGTVIAPNYSDGTVSGSTAYSYRVRAADAATNLSDYSNVASATTPAIPDTQAPTAPTNLTTTVVSSSEVNLSWTASSDNVGVTNYLIERCQGVGCTVFAQVAAAGSPDYSDVTVSGSTTYRYRVRATDAAANLSVYSNIATATTPAPPDTQAPTVPTGLSASAVSSTEISLGWTASTDNVGVTSYLIERCQGPGCSAFAQIGTAATSAYLDDAVTGSTGYIYRVRASDAAANLSGYSNAASVTTPAPSAVVTLVQARGVDAGMTSASSLAFAANNSAGNWIAVAVRAGQSGQTFAISDIGGNTYRLAAQLNDTTDGTTVALFYAENIRGGANTVTVSDSIPGGTLRFAILEYSGVSSANSLDVSATAQGTSSSPSSGLVTSAANGELIIGVISTANGRTIGPATGFAVETQVPGAPNTKLAIEDQKQLAAGPVAAAATLSASDDWGAIVAAFRPAGLPSDTQPPTPPTDLSATAVSTTQINLAWTASTDNVAVTSYAIDRCQGIGCGTFAQIGTATTAAYSDGTASSSSTYSYRVRATDAASNLSGYSNIASATTLAPPDTQAPTAPTGLSATPASSTQIDLAWTASTDNVAVTNYLIERCQGTSCGTFVQIGTTPGQSYSDSGVTGSTTYSYRVRATDAAANLSGYSNVASASTSATADTQPPSAPGTVTAAAVSGTRVDLSWVAATDNVGVVGYRVERCQGVGCSVFVKLATPTTTSFTDIGLTPSTSYTYVVLATDAAGNLGPYSNPVSVTTTATIPELIAAYSFNEGTGTTAVDLSGRGNNGSIGSAIWVTAGKYGGALSFDGNLASVVVPDSSSLHLTTGLTLEAWVKPTVIDSAWRDVIYKGDDNYFLEATSTQSGRPAAGLTLSPAVDINTYGPTALASNAWTHLAQTFDGTTVRLYVNGVQVAGTTQSGTVVTSSRPLEIGGDSIYGQYFQGLIDEVRVFNVARTPSQIQSDMTTPLGNTTAGVMLSSSNIDFGQQAIGVASGEHDVVLTNVGGSPLAIGAFDISGVNAADFVQTNDCGASLIPAGSCTIDVRFTPGAAGLRSANLTIADDAPDGPHTVTLQGAGVAVLVTPAVATLTPGRTQQFTALSEGATAFTWSVDGVTGGSSATGMVTDSGLYTAPATPGNHIVTATTPDGSEAGNATVYVVSFTGTLTFHNDNARTGANLDESVLTPGNVNATRFGKLQTFDIDGEAYASPLYVPAVAIPGAGVHNVVYVATEHDSVYAFDADGLVPTPLWRVSFINPAAGVTTVTPADVGECCDISPEIGISGTPVIDVQRGVLYVVAKTKEVTKGTTTFVQRLHALDLATGAERLGGPVVIQASVPGSGVGSIGGQVAFSALRQNQRPALLLQDGVVYIAFGSHGDQQPYHGWVLGYDATTLQQTVAYNATPNGEGAGVWIAGSGPAADSTGNIYFVTGDGTFDANVGGTSLGDSYLKMNALASILDYFTPHDQGILDSNNADLGSGGLVVLPDQPGQHPHLLVSAGKNGTIDLIDRDNMGHYRQNNDDQIVQSLINIFPFGTPEPGNYSAPVYFDGMLYFSPVSDNVQAFQLSNGLLSTTPTSRSSEIFGYPGGTLALSASGTANGILWAIEKRETAAGALRAYDATNLTIELYNSDQAGTRDTLDTATKFSAPLIANGRVYVASKTKLTIFGLLQ